MKQVRCCKGEPLASLRTISSRNQLNNYFLTLYLPYKTMSAFSFTCYFSFSPSFFNYCSAPTNYLAMFSPLYSCLGNIWEHFCYKFTVSIKPKLLTDFCAGLTEVWRTQAGMATTSKCVPNMLLNSLVLQKDKELYFLKVNRRCIF